MALDCATGNGQAARGLAPFFSRVVATDASAEQIARAKADPRIEYRVAPAEASGLPDKSVDLVTIAQALHWLDAKSVFAEARRILAPDGAIAVWGYGDPVLDSAELQELLHRFNRGTIEDYWLPERQLLLDGYAAIPFPFDEIEVPKSTLARQCSLPELMGYIRTWSATARFIAENGMGEVARLETDLAKHWGPAEQRRAVVAPLFLRAGRRAS